VYPLLRVFEGFAAHGWLLHPNATSHWATAFISVIAILQKMAVAERREAEPTTQHRNEVGLAIRQATVVLLAESCRQ